MNLFAEALEKKELKRALEKKTIEKQKDLFLEKIDVAKKVYIGFIVFVVVALVVFFIVRQATSA